MKPDFCIKNAVVVTEAVTFRGGIAVRGGQIVGLFDDDGPPADEVADAGGGLLLPGGVDPHVHFRDPGPLEEEDFATGTMSAAAGGVTTVLEQPVDLPPTIDRPTFEQKLASVQPKSYVDYGLWGGLVDDNLHHLADLADCGSVAYKAFMCASDPVYPMVDDGLLLEAMSILGPQQRLIGVHAENESIIHRRRAMMARQGITDLTAHGMARPLISEDEAIARVLMLARATGARIHILHMSSANGARMVADARRSGVAASAETCPHYLVLDEATATPAGPYAKCNPPLRSRADVERLWQAVLAGEVDCIVSDHSPYTTEAKDRGWQQIQDAPPGINGLQVGLPLVFDEGVRRRGLPLQRLVSLFSANAARLFGVYPQKGALQPGSDADVVLVDPEALWTIRSADLFCKNPWSPYDGQQVQGRVLKTWVRGRLVYDAAGPERFPLGPGYGRFLRPNASA